MAPWFLAMFPESCFRLQWCNYTCSILCPGGSWDQLITVRLKIMCCTRNVQHMYCTMNYAIITFTLHLTASRLFCMRLAWVKMCGWLYTNWRVCKPKKETVDAAHSKWICSSDVDAQRAHNRQWTTFRNQCWLFLRRMCYSICTCTCIIQRI